MSFRRRNAPVQPVTSAGASARASPAGGGPEAGSTTPASAYTGASNSTVAGAAATTTPPTAPSVASIARGNPLSAAQSARALASPGPRVLSSASSLRGPPQSQSPRSLQSPHHPSLFTPPSTARLPPSGSTGGVDKMFAPGPPPAPRLPPGVRPSPVNGMPTISTGLGSLDALFAGHGGLPLGNSLLIEQGWSTGGDHGRAIATADYASVLIKFFVAQGVAHGHSVHVIGVGSPAGETEPEIRGRAEAGTADRGHRFGSSERAAIAADLAAEWTDGLPGLEKPEDEAKRKRRQARKAAEKEEEEQVEAARRKGGQGGSASTSADAATERMKIAWRYERLGAVDLDDDMGDMVDDGTGQTRFRHAFDLRVPADGRASRKAVRFYGLECQSGVSGSSPSPPSSSSSSSAPSFLPALSKIRAAIASSAPTQIHRIVFPPIPLLDPLALAAIADATVHVPFVHALRRLVREFPARVAAVMAHPTGLVDRSSPATRWAEIVADGVIELVVLAAEDSSLSVVPIDGPSSSSSSSGQRGGLAVPDDDDDDDGDGDGGGNRKTAAERRESKPPHGFLKVHKLPVVVERGGTGVGGRKRSAATTAAFARLSLSDSSADTPAEEGSSRQTHRHHTAATQDADGGLMVAAGTEFVFTLERRNVRIRPFVLPPVESMGGGGGGGSSGGGGGGDGADGSADAHHGNEDAHPAHGKAGDCGCCADEEAGADVRVEIASEETREGVAHSGPGCGCSRPDAAGNAGQVGKVGGAVHPHGSASAEKARTARRGVLPPSKESLEF